MKFMKTNRIAKYETPCSAASVLGLYCSHVSHKKDARLIWVKSDFKLADAWQKRAN